MAGFGLFGNQPEQAPITPRMDLERKYEAGRANLMIAIVLTAINIIAPIFGADLLFMFSIYVPSYLVSYAMLLCGMYPEEFYTEIGLEGMAFLDQTFFYLCLVVALIITLVFVLCWFMSKNGKVGWMIAATALFAVDTIAIFAVGFTIECIVDLLFHAWVLYYLVVAIISHYKLKNLPEEPEVAEGGDGDGVQYDSVLDAFSNPDPNNME